MQSGTVSPLWERGAGAAMETTKSRRGPSLVFVVLLVIAAKGGAVPPRWMI